MQQFIMLMQPREDESKESPEEMQKRMQEAMAWAQEQIAKGVVKAGDPLEPQGRLLQDKNTVLSDGPFLEVKELIAGYFIIEAKDLDNAAEIAKTCPLLNYCQILVRPILDHG